MKIKQLIWVNGRAKTPFWDYGVEGYRGNWWAYCISLGWTSYQHKSKASAQAAAQADFERRVMECLEGNDDGKN